MDRPQAGVEALHQLVPVLQLNQLEGLLGPEAHNDGVGERDGALRLLYGQHLSTERGRSQAVACWEMRKVKQQFEVILPDTGGDLSAKRSRCSLCLPSVLTSWFALQIRDFTADVYPAG